MQTPWFNHLKSKQEQEDFKKSVLSSQKVLDRLKDILYNRVHSGEKTSLTDYDSPSWAYYQADQNGYVRAMREVIELLNLETNRETK